jgi:hypothetical protein
MFGKIPARQYSSSRGNSYAQEQLFCPISSIITPALIGLYNSKPQFRNRNLEGISIINYN